jgi:hypothetical protein
VHSRQQDGVFKTPLLLHNQMAFTLNSLHNVKQTANCGASRSLNFVDRSIKRHFKFTGRYKLIKTLLHFQESVFDNYKLSVLAQGTKLAVLAEIILQELKTESCEHKIFTVTEGLQQLFCLFMECG